MKDIHSILHLHVSIILLKLILHLPYNSYAVYFMVSLICIKREQWRQFASDSSVHSHNDVPHPSRLLFLLYCCLCHQGAASYDNCAPWNSYALASNQTCYNLCVHNCAAVYDGSCMTGDGFRCCLKTTPTKTQEFKTSGCNKLYNNLPGM
ncbi:hypothetical protein L5515_019674 [Caenorhabditis briggsae]|uniref:Uncharacterized protein n=1 Tax=Caenorhabditis briggsae TaxID=6238 RepID=A0AAE9FF80_CAEBR|nr:hypothetical protein L5515_019674 [Caenorhabditis briggsae]